VRRFQQAVEGECACFSRSYSQVTASYGATRFRDRVYVALCACAMFLTAPDAAVV
jgi:hypothetical protein